MCGPRFLSLVVGLLLGWLWGLRESADFIQDHCDGERTLWSRELRLARRACQFACLDAIKQCNVTRDCDWWCGLE